MLEIRPTFDYTPDGLLEEFNKVLKESPREEVKDALIWYTMIVPYASVDNKEWKRGDVGRVKFEMAIAVDKYFGKEPSLESEGHLFALPNIPGDRLKGDSIMFFSMLVMDSKQYKDYGFYSAKNSMLSIDIGGLKTKYFDMPLVGAVGNREQIKELLIKHIDDLFDNLDTFR